MPKKRKKKASVIFRVIKFLYLGLVWILQKFWKLLSFTFSKTKEVRSISQRRKIGSNVNHDEFKLTETISGDIEDFNKKITSSKSTIGIILGARGSGKSAFGMRLLENIYSKTKRKCCAIGFRKEDLPTWIEAADDIKQIPNGSFVLIDEGGILFSSRQSMKDANKLLSELLLISRHKDLSISFITQNSSNIEINVIRQADYLILKPSSLLQMDFERKKIKDIYSEMNEKYEKYKKIEGITYVYSDAFRGFITNSLPSFWGAGLSKAFRKK